MPPKYYLTFKRIKIRYKELSDLGYFNHPFTPGNKMQLMDDLFLDHSLSEDSLASEFVGVDLSAKKGKKNATDREIVDDDDSIFSGLQINSKTK